jgi:hypothetical protein
MKKFQCEAPAKTHVVVYCFRSFLASNKKASRGIWSSRGRRQRIMWRETMHPAEREPNRPDQTNGKRSETKHVSKGVPCSGRSQQNFHRAPGIRLASLMTNSRSTPTSSTLFLERWSRESLSTGTWIPLMISTCHPGLKNNKKLRPRLSASPWF